MDVVPADPTLFWTVCILGNLVPVLGAFLLSRHHPIDDRGFLLSWLLWLIGAGALIACVWSILFGSGKVRNPAWVYRLVAWLAFLQSLVLAYTVLRVI